MQVPLSQAFIESQRQALINRALELREALSEDKPAAFDARGDIADIASTVETDNRKSSIASIYLAELADIDAALTRISRGTYGICELTGFQISEARLRVFPMARFSVEAQNRVEKRRKALRR